MYDRPSSLGDSRRPLYPTAPLFPQPVAQRASWRGPLRTPPHLRVTIRIPSVRLTVRVATAATAALTATTRLCGALRLLSACWLLQTAPQATLTRPQATNPQATRLLAANPPATRLQATNPQAVFAQATRPQAARLLAPAQVGLHSRITPWHTKVTLCRLHALQCHIAAPLAFQGVRTGSWLCRQERLTGSRWCGGPDVDATYVRHR